MNSSIKIKNCKIKNTKIWQTLILQNCLPLGKHARFTSKNVAQYLLGSRNDYNLFKFNEIKHLLLKFTPLIETLFKSKLVLQAKVGSVHKVRYGKPIPPKDPARYKAWYEKMKDVRIAQHNTTYYYKPVENKRPIRILFASTNPTYAEIINQSAELCRMTAHTNRWLCGTLTANSKPLAKRLQLNKELNTFKGKSRFERQFDKTFNENKESKEQRYQWHNLNLMSQRPALAIIPDITNNDMILREAIARTIPVIGLVNSDESTKITYPIFGNSDSAQVVHFFCSFLALLLAKSFAQQEYKQASHRLFHRTRVFFNVKRKKNKESSINAFSKKYIRVQTNLFPTVPRGKEKKRWFARYYAKNSTVRKANQYLNNFARLSQHRKSILLNKKRNKINKKLVVGNDSNKLRVNVMVRQKKFKHNKITLNRLKLRYVGQKPYWKNIKMMMQILRINMSKTDWKHKKNLANSKQELDSTDIKAMFDAKKEADVLDKVYNLKKKIKNDLSQDYLLLQIFKKKLNQSKKLMIKLNKFKLSTITKSKKVIKNKKITLNLKRLKRSTLKLNHVKCNKQLQLNLLKNVNVSLTTYTYKTMRKLNVKSDIRSKHQKENAAITGRHYKFVRTKKSKDWLKKLQNKRKLFIKAFGHQLILRKTIRHSIEYKLTKGLRYKLPKKLKLPQWLQKKQQKLSIRKNLQRIIKNKKRINFTSANSTQQKKLNRLFQSINKRLLKLNKKLRLNKEQRTAVWMKKFSNKTFLTAMLKKYPHIALATKNKLNNIAFRRAFSKAKTTVSIFSYEWNNYKKNPYAFSMKNYKRQKISTNNVLWQNLYFKTWVNKTNRNVFKKTPKNRWAKFKIKFQGKIKRDTTNKNFYFSRLTHTIRKKSFPTFITKFKTSRRPQYIRYLAKAQIKSSKFYVKFLRKNTLHKFNTPKTLPLLTRRFIWRKPKVKRPWMNRRTFKNFNRVRNYNNAVTASNLSHVKRIFGSHQAWSFARLNLFRYGPRFVRFDPKTYAKIKEVAAAKKRDSVIRMKRHMKAIKRLVARRKINRRNALRNVELKKNKFKDNYDSNYKKNKRLNKRTYTNNFNYKNNYNKTKSANEITYKNNFNNDYNKNKNSNERTYTNNFNQNIPHWKKKNKKNLNNNYNPNIKEIQNKNINKNPNVKVNKVTEINKSTKDTKNAKVNTNNKPNEIKNNNKKDSNANKNMKETNLNKNVKKN